MSLRAPKDTVESLRITLHRLEQTDDPGQDSEDRAELKRILLVRIANIEAIEALKAESLAPATSENPKSTPCEANSPSPLPDLVSNASPDMQPVITASETGR